MVIVSAAIAAFGIAAVAKTVLLVASIVYQQSQARKLKRASRAAADRAKGIDVKTEFQSEALSVVYGLNKVGGNVVWAALRSNYVHTDGQLVGVEGAVSHVRIDTSQQLMDAIRNLSNGDHIVWDGGIYRRNATAPAANLNIRTSLLLSLYFVYVAPSSQLASTAGRFAQVISNLVMIAVGNRSSLSPLFFGSTLPNVDAVHQTLTNSISGNRQEFLFVQQAICVGGIDAVVTAEIDGKPIDTAEFRYGHRIDVAFNTANPNNMIIANVGSERSGAVFTNMAHASMCFRLNRDEPQYASVPRVEFVVKGQRVRDIVWNGSAHVFTVNRIYTDNPALILADYLTSSVYGRGLPDNALDLTSFFNAKNVAGTIVSNSVEYTGHAGLSRGGPLPESVVVGPSPLYSCNLVLDTDADVWENIQKILDTMNDPSLLWSEGRYKLQLDYPNSDAAQNALVRTTFTEADVLNEEIDIIYPSQDDRLNQATVRFRNSNTRFSDDSVTWPKRNSTVLNTYLAQDNGVSLKTDVYISGTVDPYHAQAIAEQMVRESRYAAVVEFTVRKKGVRYEPGDLVRLNLSTLGINQIVRILEVEAREGLATSFKAKFFDWRVLAWNADNNQPGVNLPAPIRITSVPTDFVFSEDITERVVGFLSGRLTWSHPSVGSVEFILSVQRLGENEWRTLGTTNITSFDVPQLASGSYLFSIQARAVPGGRLSDRIVADYEVVGISSPLNASITQQPYNIRFVWAPDTSSRLQSYSVYANLALTQLLGRSDSNFFDWPVRQNCGICSTGGIETIYVVSNYIDGDNSQPSPINFSIQAPSIQNLSFRFDKGEMVLTWQDSTNQFAVESYRIETAGQEPIFIYASTFKQDAQWIGQRTWSVTPIDVAGNEGPTQSIDVTVVAPSAVVNLGSRAVINNVLIDWERPVQGTLPIDNYEVRKGSSPTQSTSIGFFQGTFCAIFEDAQGDYQYWVAPIDSAGNYGPWSSTSTSVVAPRGFRLVQDEMMELPPEPVFPINRTETWAQHFTTRGWNSPSSQIAAGYPVFIQPAAPFEEVTYEIDLGTVVSSFQIQAVLDKQTVTGPLLTAQVFFSYKELISDPWTTVPEGRTVFVNTARYVRLRVRFESNTELTDITMLSGLEFKALVIQKDESGTALVRANDVDGTLVTLRENFIDIESITLTVVNSQTPKIAISVFDDQPYPENFAIKVFDIEGNRVDASVSWIANGV
jgi:hypothetical protein